MINRNYFFVSFFIIINTNSLEDIINSLSIQNANEIINHFNNKSNIIINDIKITGTKTQVVNNLDNFFDQNNFNELKIIHSGNSDDNIIYLLGEYISNDDLYKVLALIKNNNNNHSIQKLTINKKE
jgi:hypothetical protein|tara:strand:+ start:188 stop:565 length:378 start_codon:yes stop_codon:yes gene_type:complete